MARQFKVGEKVEIVKGQFRPDPKESPAIPGVVRDIRAVTGQTQFLWVTTKQAILPVTNDDLEIVN